MEDTVSCYCERRFIWMEKGVLIVKLCVV